MKELELAKEYAQKAGRAVMEVREKGEVGSILKPDGTPYTKGDEVSQVVLGGLGEVSGYPVLSEELREDKERYQATQERYKSMGRVWINDELDGTKEYAKGLDEFAISVALIEEGEPIVGAVCAPARNWLMFREKGGGAYQLNLKTGLETRLKTSEVVDFEKMRLLVSSSELNLEAYPDYVNNLIWLRYQIEDNQSQDPRVEALGSTTLKTSLIASGYADYNFTFTAWDHEKDKLRKTKEWDIAASYLLVKEAGGEMTDCLGNDFVFGKEDPVNYKGIVTSNSKENHKGLLEIITEGIDFEGVRKKYN